jgi:hypothetical protein
MKTLKDLTDELLKDDSASAKELVEKSKSFALENTNIKEHAEKVLRARGSAIETSIQIESIFDAFLVHFKEKVKGVRFRSKAEKIEEISRKIDPKEKVFDKTYYEKLGRFVAVRNIFAHEAIDYISDKIFFLEQTMSLKELLNELYELAEEIRDGLIDLADIIIKEGGLK